MNRLDFIQFCFQMFFHVFPGEVGQPALERLIYPLYSFYFVRTDQNFGMDQEGTGEFSRLN